MKLSNEDKNECELSGSCSTNGKIIHVCLCVYMCVCAYIYTHTHTHTHTRDRQYSYAVWTLSTMTIWTERTVPHVWLGPKFLFQHRRPRPASWSSGRSL